MNNRGCLVGLITNFLFSTKFSSFDPKFIHFLSRHRKKMKTKIIIIIDLKYLWKVYGILTNKFNSFFSATLIFNINNPKDDNIYSVCVCVKNIQSNWWWPLIMNIVFGDKNIFHNIINVIDDNDCCCLWLGRIKSIMVDPHTHINWSTTFRFV